MEMQAAHELKLQAVKKWKCKLPGKRNHLELEAMQTEKSKKYKPLKCQIHTCWQGIPERLQNFKANLLLRLERIQVPKAKSFIGDCPSCAFKWTASTHVYAMWQRHNYSLI
ncbi:hypothetical protein M8J77_015262 [Diaphorina citri]|nr:hypothetical protein M8J77_015262 [Diaphorina citri]